MKKQLLQSLANFLKTPEVAGHFNLNTWKSDCGTTACALGWACEIPEFQKLGLYCYNLMYQTPVFETSFGYRAAALFFDISLEKIERLFCPNEYPEEDQANPLAVAQRIEEFIGTVK